VEESLFRRKSLFLLLLFSLIAMSFAPAAFATAVYGDFFGTDMNFIGIQETSLYGDPEPLFGAPIASGNSLEFFPDSFSASAAGASGFDQTGSHLQGTVEATTVTHTIGTIILTEFGDAALTGIGTVPGATGALALLSGFVTVLETTAGPITSENISFVGIFTPSGSEDDMLLLGLPGDAGPTSWSASAVIDVASVVPNATLVHFGIDNNLMAFSEAGTTALIQKKVVSGPAFSIIIIPEPTTAILLGMGLLGLALRSPGRRF
jgi:hypothetical protein